MNYIRKFYSLFLTMLILFLDNPLIAEGDSESSAQNKPDTTNVYQTNAIWCSAFLGGGEVFDTDKDNEYFNHIVSIGMSAHFRYHHTIVSIGEKWGMFSENI